MQSEQDDVWAHVLLNRMSRVVGERELDSWSVSLCEAQAPALLMLGAGQRATLRTLLRDPRDRQRQLPCIVLMHRRGETIDMLPGELCELQAGDEILFCGLGEALREMEWSLKNYNVLQYLLTGQEHSHTLLSRLLYRKEAQ
ncbi:hypothetical protein [Marinobacterium aestuariivivens]|uniref:RCK C-terminal domain-containing protein n=1 Tax=Marinobacterium aestuariivivens TaxID=1698799 RepID=A0ABW1ZWH2_9GAMM